MATDVKLDAERVCRVCLQERSELFLIFEEAYAADEGVKISEILSECTRYKVERYDNLPHQICGACMEDARTAFSFKRRTERAYRTLVGLMPEEDWQEHNNRDFNSVDNGTQTDKLMLHPCEYCGDKFFDVLDLREHRLEAHRGSEKVCRVCGEKFGRLRDLSCHLSQEHPSEGLTKAIQCTVCGRNFSRKEHLRRHVRKVHHLITPEGNKVEPMDNDVKLNAVKIERKLIKGEPNELWYNCGPCGKQFAQIRELRDHMKNEHPYEGKQCTMCDSKFKRKEHLRRHIQNVHNEHLPEEGNKISLEEPEIALSIGEPIAPDGNNAKSNEVHWFNYDGYNNDAAVDDDNDDDDDEGDDRFAVNPISCDDEDASNSMRLDSMLFKQEPELQIKVEREDGDEPPLPQYAAETLLAACQDAENARKAVKNESQMETRSAERRKATPITRLVHARSDKMTNPENRCFECGRTFSRHCHLQRHMLTHREEKPHACTHCEKRFSRTDHLKKHELNVHNTKEFKCEQCKCAFVRLEDLTRHIATRHGENRDTYKVHDCEHCGKKFTSKTYLRKHILIHTDRIFACRHCEETFKERKQMREHEKSHTSGRNFLCSICGESFVRNDYLRVHMRRHNGEKPYKCQYCAKGFPRATDLKIHERYHTGHKPNLCTLCGKSFHRAFNLTIHMRTHTGERPFKCEHCDKSFAQSNDLKSHVRRIHTGERYKCNNCDAGFLHLYSLRQHAFTAHGIQIESTTGRLQKFLPPAPIAGDAAVIMAQQQISQADISSLSAPDSTAAASMMVSPHSSLAPSPHSSVVSPQQHQQQHQHQDMMSPQPMPPSVAVPVSHPFTEAFMQNAAALLHSTSFMQPTKTEGH